MSTIYGSLLSEEFNYNSKEFLDNLEYYFMTEDIEISAKEINEMFDINLNNEIITEAAISNMISGVLNKLGLSKAAPKISAAVNDTAKKITTTLKEDGIGKESRQSILATISDMMDDITTILNDFNEEITFSVEQGTPQNIAKSISLTLIASCVNTLALIIFSIIITPAAGQIVCGCICAPICEEFCKRTAIKGKYIKEFTIVFNMLEFSQYVGSSMGIYKISKVIILRIFTIGLHLATTVTQWLMNNPKFLEKIGINKDNEDAQKKCSVIGYVIGVLMHAAWNTSGSVGKLAKAAEKFLVG